jgi:multicomponent Na+:H+ antiporter subunit D
MTANAAVLPVALPLATALLLLAWRPGGAKRWIAGFSAAAQLVLAGGLIAHTFQNGPLALALGGWLAPYGIVLMVDLLAAIMLGLGAVTALAILLFGFAELPSSRAHPLRLPLVQFLMTGINLSFCTADLFNLFVAFEVMLIASYALLTLEADDWDIKQAFPYLAMNLVGGTLFLAAAGLAYGLFGSLNFAAIAERSAAMADDPRVVALGLMLVVVFGLKAGVFPLYFWLPNSYPILPAPLAALYGGLLTKVGVYALLRMFGQVLPPELPWVRDVLGWAGVATMWFGVLGAVSRNFVRGILSWHILSQIGYMLLALSLGSPLALAAAILFVGHNILVKSSLFLVGGAVSAINGTDDLTRTGGLWRHAPVLGTLFLLQALSLAGLPPLSGFWGKYLIVFEAIGQRSWLFAALALGAGMLTLFSMLKIWLGAFWNEARAETPLALGQRRLRGMTAAIGVMTAAALAMGLGMEHCLRVTQEAVRQLTDCPAYIQFILGERPAPSAAGSLPETP